jgi:hypothetical protein
MAPYDAAMYRALTVSGIEDAAQQSNNQATLMVTKIEAATAAPQKRHSSLDSTSHPENSWRAKRHPAAAKLALPEYNTDRPDSTVLQAESCPSLIGPDMPNHAAATTEGDANATESLDPVSDYIEIYSRQPESVAFDGVEIVNRYSYEVFGNEQGYIEQPLYDDQSLSWNQQNIETQYDDRQYCNNNQQPYDDQQIYYDHQSFNFRH